MNMMKSNPQELDEKRLNAMKVKILEAEMKNLKTREKNDAQMVEKITSIISNEAGKKY